MSKYDILEGVILSEDVTLSFVEVCHQCQLSEEMLADWLAHGLLGDEIQPVTQSVQFTHSMLNRIRSANRLHRELQINIQGAILALELLDQINALQDELKLLKKYE